MKEKIIFAIVLVLILYAIFPSAFALVSCQNCYVNSPNGCTCSISECASGYVDIYQTATCAGQPGYEFSFSNGIFPWFPNSSATYYMMALCDDGLTKSTCSLVSVSAFQITTATTQTQTQQTTQTQTTSGGSSNAIFYAIVVVIIAVVAFVAYRLLGKKKPKIDYESLYRKWGR